MALSLGVSVGDRISVGTSIVKVRAIKNPELFVITVNGGPNLSVNADKTHAVEILPGVRVFIGLGKNGNQNRLAFDAPKAVPIRRLDEEIGLLELKAEALKVEELQEALVASALLMNGVDNDTLVEILKSTETHPGQTYYLQPHATSRIVLLAESVPTSANPTTIYLSVEPNLNHVSYRAKAVGWQDKRKLDEAARTPLNQHIQQFQQSEGSIFLNVKAGKPCVNLISVVDLERVQSPFPVSCLIKISNGEPLKNRERSGGWVAVRKVPDWLGTMPLEVKEQVEIELAAGVARSLKDSVELRLQRLASAPKLPEAIQVVSRAYRRNPDVITEVLRRANGVCARCHAPAPFQRTSDNSPYLEVHHRIMLSNGGEDIVENAIALCPNCHRRFHFGWPDEHVAEISKPL